MAENNSSAPLKTAEAIYPPLPEPRTFDVHGWECFSDIQMRAYVDAARAMTPVAAQAAPAAVAVPSGWKLVPLQDTPKMWTAGGQAIKSCGGHDRDAASLAYKAMLEAAPTPALPATEDSSAGDLAEGPAGSGGWKVHAESLEKECAYWKTLAETMRAHQSNDVWYWQGDGNDNPKSMVNSLAVVIRAADLRDLMAKPLAEVQAEPVIYVSRGQLETHTDPESDGGRYLPARRTPLGLLNYPLYTAPQAQPADALDAWQAIGSLPTCDDLIWLYCQDTNTIDGPVAPHPMYEDSWTHWAYAEAPSTVAIDAAMAAAQEGGKA